MMSAIGPTQRARLNFSYMADTTSNLNENDFLNESMRSLMNVKNSEEGSGLQELDEADIQTLKNNILFKYMNPERLKSLILDNIISLKKKTYVAIILVAFFGPLFLYQKFNTRKNYILGPGFE